MEAFDMILKHYIKHQINISNIDTFMKTTYIQLSLMSLIAIVDLFYNINIFMTPLIFVRIFLGVHIKKTNNRELYGSLYRLESALTLSLIISLIPNLFYGLFFDMGIFFKFVRFRNTIFLISYLDIVFKNSSVIYIMIFSLFYLIFTSIFEIFVFLAVPFTDRGDLEQSTERLFRMSEKNIKAFFTYIFSYFGIDITRLISPRQINPIPPEIFQNVFNQYNNFIERVERVKQYIEGLPIEEEVDPEFVCSICHNDEHENDVNIIKLRCGHLFHRDCILSSVNNNILTCPNCREPIIE